MEDDNTLVEWEAYEYKIKERKPDWFWALGIVGVAGSVIAFIQSNFLFGIFIILASFAIIFFAASKPKRLKYKITTDGLHFDGRLYPFHRLKTFWMLEEDGEKKLIIKSDKTFTPLMVMRFESDDTGDAIHDVLSQILEQEELQETFAHQIMDRLGF